MSTQVAIIGAGGFAREVLDVFDACNLAGQDYEVLGYIVDAKYGTPGTIVNAKPVLGGFDWLASHAKDVYVTCAIGAPELRRALVRRAAEVGARFVTVIHPTAILTSWVEIGEGVIITAGCIFTNQIRIGNHVHVNLDCTIGHDVVMGDFVTLAPGVHVSGNVRFSEGCYVGTGANLIEKISVGEWSMIGAGSAIVREVPANTTVVGMPGKVLKTREAGWHLGESA